MGAGLVPESRLRPGPRCELSTCPCKQRPRTCRRCDRRRCEVRRWYTTQIPATRPRPALAPDRARPWQTRERRPTDPGDHGRSVSGAGPLGRSMDASPRSPRTVMQQSSERGWPRPAQNRAWKSRAHPVGAGNRVPRLRGWWPRRRVPALHRTPPVTAPMTTVGPHREGSRNHMVPAGVPGMRMEPGGT